MNNLPLILSLIVVVFVRLAHTAAGHQPGDPAPLKFAAAEIELAAKDAKQPVPDVTLSVTPGKAQSYRIEREGTKVRVIGGDATGAMYGGLDLAEVIRLGTLDTLQSADHQPHIEKCGIKFNIPLDLRTPSYTDRSDADQANIPEVWELDFWIDYLDAMAHHRYNVLSLWSLHPFPSMVKVPEFPEVALNDVWRTKAMPDDTFSMAGNDMVRPEMLADHEVVKRITMDEKIEFWRWVRQPAADRGITLHVFTWHVFTFGAQGKHGITNDMGNDITKAYFRASVREMAKTYPLLGGMGITAGEGMPHDMDSKPKEKGLWDTYGEGVREALQHEPKRDFNMIHRFHWMAQSDILDAFKGFYTVTKFMEGNSMPGSKILCIRDWRKRLIERTPMIETTPLEIAGSPEGAAAATFASIESLRESAKAGPELQKIVNDCAALAWLGCYYAAKIRGTCALVLFDANGDKFEQDAALRRLEDALIHWKKYAASRDANYVPALYNRIGSVDITAITARVATDIGIAKAWKPGTLKDDGKRAGSAKGFRQ